MTKIIQTSTQTSVLPSNNQSRLQSSCLSTPKAIPSATSPSAVRLHSFHLGSTRSLTDTHQGPDSNTSESTGTIKKVLTEPDTVGDRHVNASDDDPRYEVSRTSFALVAIHLADHDNQIENANTGKTSAIYERNILGKAE